jgi:hypothetical protein
VVEHTIRSRSQAVPSLIRCLFKRYIEHMFGAK